MAFIAINTCVAGLPLKISMLLKTSSARTGPSRPRRKSGWVGVGAAIVGVGVGVAGETFWAGGSGTLEIDAEIANRITATARVFIVIASVRDSHADYAQEAKRQWHLGRTVKDPRRAVEELRLLCRAE